MRLSVFFVGLGNQSNKNTHTMKNLNLGNVTFIIASLVIIGIGIKFVSEIITQNIVLY